MLVALATVYLNLVQPLVDQGFSDALVQRESLDQDHMNAAFWLNLISGSVLALVTWSAAGVIAGIFREPQLAPLLRALSVIFVLAATRWSKRGRSPSSPRTAR